MIEARPLFLIVAVAAALAASPGCVTQKRKTRSRPAVKVLVVEPSVVNTATRYAGNILPEVRVDVVSRAGGHVESIEQVKGPDGRKHLVQEGDHVKAGQVLAKVKASEAHKKKSDLKAALAEARTALEPAQKEWDRVRDLYERQTATKAEFDRARAAFSAAQQRVSAAKAAMSQSSGGAVEASIKSPIDGTIGKRLIEVGSSIAAGTPAFVVIDARSLRALFTVPDTAAGNVKVGQPILVRVDGAPKGEVKATVTRVTASADVTSRIFEIEASLPNPDDAIKPGMSASMRIQEGGSAQPQVLLPLAAIVRSPTNKEGYAVYVIDANDNASAAKTRDVELGEFLGNSVPVVSGLSVGERVVVSGTSMIAAGESVRVIP